MESTLKRWLAGAAIAALGPIGLLASSPIAHGLPPTPPEPACDPAQQPDCVPPATVLLPYFEVDLDKPGSTLLSNTRTVTGDVDIYDVPGGEGEVIGMLDGGEGQKVELAAPCQSDNWCQVSGKGWVWGDFLKA